MARSIKNLIAALLIAFSLFWSWTDILPRRSYTTRLKPVLEERVALLESRNQIVKKMADLSNEIRSKFAEIQRLTLVIPPDEDLPELLTTTESIFLGTGNSIKSIKIGVTAGPNILNNMYLDLASSNQYSSLLLLLNHLEKNIRLMDIDTISMVSENDGGSEQINFTIKAITNFLKTPEEIRKLESSRIGEQAVKEE